MGVDFEVREFRESDELEARKVVLEGLGERFGFIDASLNPDLHTIAAHYPNEGHVFLVAESAEGLIGTTGLVFEASDRARLVRMSVDRSLRRHGVARALLARATKKAVERGIVELRVATQPEWGDAVAFYRAEGFEPYDRDPIDVHMRRFVAAPGSPRRTDGSPGQIVREESP
ncbi:MAG: GNAT family N-acetyltransferase [Myxococcota bacterium]